MAEIEKNQLETPSATDNSPTEVNEAGQTQFEQQRYTRRQALRKFGFGAGLSAFMLLSVDDLARMVGRQLQQAAGDNQVANQIAEEFRNAGVAFAGPSDPCQGLGYCDCCNKKYANCIAALPPHGDPTGCRIDWTSCNNSRQNPSGSGTCLDRPW